jgi:predicted Zn-dependent protease
MILLLPPLLIGCASDKKVQAQADQFDASLHAAELSQPDVNAYFTAIGRRVQAAAKIADAQHYGPKSHFVKDESDQWMFSEKVQFHLVNSKTLNAFTTGGYHVYVYNELFQQTKSEDELAAVIAHEFGHIYARHVHKGMNRSMATMGIEGLAGAAGYVAGGSDNGAAFAKSGASAGAMAAQFVIMGFTRGDEAQADELGFHFYCIAGWDPAHFGNFFKHMIAAGYDKTPAIESDYPTLASRVKATDARVATLGPNAGTRIVPNIATPEQFRQYQQLAVVTRKSIPDDQTALQAKQMLQALPRSCWVPYEPADRQSALDELLAELHGKPAPAGE